MTPSGSLALSNLDTWVIIGLSGSISNLYNILLIVISGIGLFFMLKGSIDGGTTY